MTAGNENRAAVTSWEEVKDARQVIGIVQIIKKLVAIARSSLRERH
jgi:hypothetical protein